MSAYTSWRFSLPRTIRRFSVPILLFWLALSVLTNIAVPKLEAVAAAHNVALIPPNAPSMQAMKRMGEVFKEFHSDSVAMIVLESDQPLTDKAHLFYNDLIQKLREDTKHVQHVQDFWGDTLTAAGAQSNDAKAAYVQVYLAGNQGEALANESVNAVRKIVLHTPAPPAIKVYVTGAAPLIADQFAAGSAGTAKVTVITVLVIALMLLFVYRSIITTVVILMTVMVELAAARGAVALLGSSGIIDLSTYATNLLTLLVIAAGTDYVVFFLGRYQEALSSQSRENAFYTMFDETAHVIFGSGLTVAGAVFCLTFTRLPYFHSFGIPAAVGVVVALIASLTLTPAVITLGSRFRLLEPKRMARTRGWRRIGTAAVRWPGPILVVTCGISIVGLLALPGYKTSYDSRRYLPDTSTANIGHAAADRHFSQARMNPELLMIETDHDMRNPADMLILDKISKSIFHLRRIAKVQAITRPLGTPIDHSSIPFQISMQAIDQSENLSYQRQRADDLLKQANELKKMISILEQQSSLQQSLADATHSEAASFHDTISTMNTVRDNIANFVDFFLPFKSYFYWERHCFDIPICWSIRSIWDSLDGIDDLSDKFQHAVASLDKLDSIQPQLVKLLPSQIASQMVNLALVLKNYSTSSGINAQQRALTENAAAMGKAFDTSKKDDSFYLPPEAFKNPDFLRGLKLFLSPDGRATRMIITHDGDPATLEGISHIEPILNAAHDAVKGTPLANAKFYLAGTAATYKDIHDMAKYDLMIVVIAALSLILLIMIFITGSLVAAVVIVGTVALSLGTSFGLSVFIWQDIFGTQLYWIVMALAIIVLLAVGSDYNLLLISRFKSELHAGLNTGIIRAMAGTGSVVTVAGLIFAATMSSFIVSDLKVLGQIGTTIGLGLLFDTLIVRSFMTPSIAALLGRWFWWPKLVRSRPARPNSGPLQGNPDSRVREDSNAELDVV
ncbi:MMPL/RND family transporter [Mycobacterium montefiorense]|uniref:MMPL/RND family transporter n=3 Tax=Mycobacterium montefiorense TaxID=154654 RepID=UPI0021F3162F|nr:MMPL family transporter [Mycobacterium montefiorense]MCV7426913.1 MMPL family transporter [Mycobacterium montefiorense]